MSQPELFSRLFFLNPSLLLQESPFYDEKTGTWKKQRGLARVYRALHCNYCTKTFHKAFGLIRHTKKIHLEEIQNEFKNGSQVQTRGRGRRPGQKQKQRPRQHRQRRDVFKDVDEAFTTESDSDSEDEEEFFRRERQRRLNGHAPTEPTRRNYRRRRQRQSYSTDDGDGGDDTSDDVDDDDDGVPLRRAVSIEPATWPCLEQMSEFQPVLTVYDCYKSSAEFEELSEKFNLPEEPLPGTTHQYYSRLAPLTTTPTEDGDGGDGDDSDRPLSPASEKRILRIIAHGEGHGDDEDGSEIEILDETSSSGLSTPRKGNDEVEETEEEEVVASPSPPPPPVKEQEEEEEEEEEEPLRPNPRLRLKMFEESLLNGSKKKPRKRPHSKNSSPAKKRSKRPRHRPPSSTSTADVDDDEIEFVELE